MENQTSFDLNRQLQDWRQKLAQSPAFRAENLDELEAHLRDSTTRLQSGGLSAEEAFQIATRRIGGNGVLATEYGKVNRREIWMTRLLWMLVGLQVWGLVNFFTTNLARAAFTLAMSPFNPLGSGQSANGLFHGLAIPLAICTLAQLLALGGSLALCAWLTMGKGQYFGQRVARLIQRKHVLVSSGVILIVMLLATLLGITPVALLFRFYGNATLHAATQAESYAMGAVGLVQVVTLLILTIVLAGKRFNLNKTTEAHQISTAMPGSNPIELESGLSASAGHLQAQGLSAEEAFLIATQRLGNNGLPEKKARRDAELGVWAERALWMLVGVQLWGSVGRMARPFAKIVSIFALNQARSLNPAGGQWVQVGVVTLIHLTALAGSLGLCWWLIMCQGPALGAWVKRTSGWRVSVLGAGVVLTSWASAWFASNLVLASPQAHDATAAAASAVTRSMIFSEMLTEPCRMITFIILTVILAKKSLHPGNPARLKLTPA